MKDMRNDSSRTSATNMAVRSRVTDSLLGIGYSEYQLLSQNSRVPYLEYPTRDRKATRVGLLHQTQLPGIRLLLVSARNYISLLLFNIII